MKRDLELEHLKKLLGNNEPVELNDYSQEDLLNMKKDLEDLKKDFPNGFQNKLQELLDNVNRFIK